MIEHIELYDNPWKTSDKIMETEGKIFNQVGQEKKDAQLE